MKILILNGTISEIPIIKTAQRLGHYVVTTGNMPHLPGHRVSDEYIPEDYSDVEAILELVKKNGIEGIVSCANDFGVITSAYVAEKMGWKGHDTYRNARLLHHKDEFRDYFLKAGFPTPSFRTFEDPESALGYCDEIGYPVMIKASDMTGGKGIRRADDREAARGAIKRSFEASRGKRILVEEFLDGIQQSIVVFMINKRAAITSSSNIYCMRNPYLVQAETYPAEDFESVKPKLHEMMHKMADDLGLADGIFSFQYIVKDGVPYVIDMMRRCFGNETLLLADVRTGFPWEEAYVRAALGEDVSHLICGEQVYGFCGHYGVMAEHDGVLKHWELPEDIRKRTFKTTVLMENGDVIGDHLTEKIALIYFSYDSLEQMNREIVAYNDRIRIDIV